MTSLNLYVLLKSVEQWLKPMLQHDLVSHLSLLSTHNLTPTVHVGCRDTKSAFFYMEWGYIYTVTVA